LWLISTALSLLPMGCSTNADEDVLVTALDEPKTGPTWEAFLRDATRVSRDGQIYYVVEGDLPIATRTELREYYDSRVRGLADKGVVHRFNGVDDVWLDGDQLHLRYCVDEAGFNAAPSGRTGAEMIAAMHEATTAWEQVGNVQFAYDSANNGNCGVSDSIPDSRYIKVSRDDSQGGACAFGPQSHAGWTCAGLDGNTIGVNGTAFSNATIAAVMMHELGHVLGLHHEQFHTNGGGCSAGGVRDVTASADLVSIMGYSFGSGGCALTTPGNDLSELDGWTIRTFYGMPAAWYVPLF
jgi:hypothetical protein